MHGLSALFLLGVLVCQEVLGQSALMALIENLVARGVHLSADPVQQLAHLKRRSFPHAHGLLSLLKGCLVERVCIVNLVVCLDCLDQSLKDPVRRLGLIVVLASLLLVN